MKILGLNLLLFTTFTHSAHSAQPQIKVRIGKALHNITLSGSDIKQVIKGSLRKKVFPGRKKISFNCGPVLKKIKKEKPMMLTSLISKAGLIKWNKTGYVGRLNIVTSVNRKGCDLVNQMPLESYISSLLAKEMSPTWPIEALKAQAVAARSYAYHKMITKQVSKESGYNVFYDLENSEKHQVNGSFFDTTTSTSMASRETKGEVLLIGSSELTPIFFHSKCGGKTLRPDQVWSNHVKGYRSVDCAFCHKHGKKRWTHKMSKKKFNKLINKTLIKYHHDYLKTKNPKLVRLTPDSKSKAFLRVYDDERVVVIKKARIRSLLGRKKAASNYFNITEKASTVELSGNGFGHGVGLCQYGALELAKRGYTYKQILSHYFPEHNLKKIY
jgi:stage II sporulation protein D